MGPVHLASLIEGAMYFHFQESRIWEGGDQKADPSRSIHKIKAKTEVAARRKLPKSELGRRWILIKTTASTAKKEIA